MLKKLIKLFNKDSSKCECGKHKTCIRKVYGTGNGRLFVKNEEHFKCGIVQSQIESLIKLNKNEQIKNKKRAFCNTFNWTSIVR